ncbi:MAG: transposase, partial [Acidimicrobiaceae bacterium]|nr:transposase [Acidimicrobiaceae bacterium]
MDQPHALCAAASKTECWPPQPRASWWLFIRANSPLGSYRLDLTIGVGYGTLVDMNTEVETHKAPGRHWRQGITLIELAEMFPTEEAAEQWFESVVWANGRVCGHCGADDTYAVKSGKPMP